MSYAISTTPRSSRPTTALPILLSSVGLALAYGLTQLIAPITVSLFVALHLFGFASGLILSSYLLTLRDAQPQWTLLLSGQTIAALAFITLLVGIIV